MYFNLKSFFLKFQSARKSPLKHLDIQRVHYKDNVKNTRFTQKFPSSDTL